MGVLYGRVREAPLKESLVTSVVIAVFNGAEILRLSVPAVLAAHGVDEVVWVDDGSTDATRAVLDELVGHDPRAKVLGLGTNRGRSAARNRGVAATIGQTVVFFDADVAPSIGSVIGLANQIDSRATASVARLKPVADHPDEPYQDYASRYSRGPDGDLEAGAALDWRYFVTGACAISRETLKAVGGFDEAVPYGEDQALAQRLAAVDPTGLRLAQPYVTLHDIGDLGRALENAGDYGRSLVLQPEGVSPGPIKRFRPLAPFVRHTIPLARSAVSRLPPGTLRRRLVRYLLGATALTAFAHARDDAPSGHPVHRGR
ncbi:glycosyltransferase [Rubrivirga sp.]|uniref:glycosyltransferase n=1 Tax=Rubrivirga sp. TaxID=1885344 RepID=UPI003C78DF47